MTPDEAWGWIAENEAAIQFITTKHMRIWPSLDRDDVFQEVKLNAYQLLLRYDDSKGAKASTYVFNYAWMEAQVLRRRHLLHDGEFPVRFAPASEPREGSNPGDWTWPEPGVLAAYDEATDKLDARNTLGSALEVLDEREALVIRRRFWDNKILEDIGTEIGLTRERVRQIEGIALRKLQWAVEAA